MEWFHHAIQEFLDWLNADQYSFWQEWFAYAVKWLVYAKIQFILHIVPFSWGIAKAVLDQLNVSQTLNEAWAGLDSYILGWLTYLRVPDAINILLNAYVTRIVMRVMGWGL